VAGPVLAARSLIKRFGGVTALKGVSFELQPGEIHAICGENGAGKSTLIKILGGIHAHGSYEGDLLLDGSPARFRGTADAQRAGIGVIHQELALVPEMTVAENIALGAEPRRLGLVDRLEMDRRARELLARFAIRLDPEGRVGALGVGQQQLVEIARALGKDSRVLILDEPTAALGESESRALLAMLRELRGRGIACILISHRLDEVFAVADRITVLRDGESVASMPAAQASRESVIRQMVGRELGELFARTPTARGAALLEVDGLSVDPPGDGGIRLRGVSITAHAGEVLGIGGLMGSGRSELLLHLFGAWGRRIDGRVRLGGADLDGHTPADAIARGLTLVAEDRKRLGLVLDRSIGFNLSLPALSRYADAGLLDAGREYAATGELFRRLRVRAPDLDVPVRSLSGGNQQKVVIGKALITGPRVVLLDEPTRGIDVGAKREVYAIIDEITAAGHAVVLVSSELPELMGIADRIVMLGEGRVGGEFARGACSADELLAASLRAAEQARLSTEQPVP
jgi:D-xylose transport system ATP-binding protein